MISERIEALRAQMEQRNIEMYIVPTSDFHESEYVGDYFKARKYMTGFTGSAGTAVITKTQAGLWTDGRYFIQAEQQLKDTPVTLFKMSEEGVPTVIEFIKKNLSQGGCLGFDGRVMNSKTGEEYEKIVMDKKGSLHTTEDLVGLIWLERPQLPKNPVFILEEKYAGESTQSKLKRVRTKMEEKKANVHILTSLYDVAWFLNIRGGDIDCVPVVLSFITITEHEVNWFIHEEVLNPKLKEYCKENKITIKAYAAMVVYFRSHC
ncbi:MAG: aminopeptidase P family N-terminal domain-containing protein, partial [Lachnospiraceae bacterium]